MSKIVRALKLVPQTIFGLAYMFGYIVWYYTKKIAGIKED